MAELAAALESQDTDQEGGIIRCVCGLAEDDGYTIQCELCEVWQHILCVIIDPKNEPETYLCEECSPRWIDAEGARERQLRRRQAEQDLARDTLEDQDSVKATARAFALGEHTLDFVDDVFEPPQPRKRSVSAYSITNTSGQQNFDLPPAKKKRKSRGNPVSYEPSTPPFEHSLAQYTHSRKSTVVQVPVDDIDQQESWAYEYTEVDHNLWPDPQAIEHVRLALESWFAYEGQPYRISAQKVKTQSSSPTSPYTLQWSRHPIPEGETGYYASYKDVEDVGLCAPLGPVVLPDKNISDSHITVKNVPSTSFSLAPPLSTPFLPSNTCTAPTSACPYPRPVSQAVYASMALAPGDLITTFAGQVLSRNTYKANKTSQYDLLGAPKPGVRALPMPWSVMVDARHFGNFGRFARSGCAPNAVIRPVVYNQRKIGGEVETFDFTFGLFALQDIARKEEVILPWDWDDDHLVHLIPRLLFSREFRDRMSLASLSQHLASVSSALFPLMPCSCTKRKSCAPSWMYRLACCSQPTSMGGNARRDFLDPSLVEEKVRALLVGGGRGGKKGVELSSVGFSRGWEPDPEPAVDRSDPIDVLDIRTNTPDQSMEVDDWDKKSQASVDSDATEPLPDRNAFSSENTTEQAVEASQNTTEQAVEASQNTTEQAVEASLAQISLGQESLSPKRPSESASHALSLEEQQIVPPSLPQTSTAEASEEPEPNEQVAEYQQTDPSLQVVETSNREEDPVPEPEPPKPRTPSPPPIPKAKVSFAAFMKRRKDNPEPSKPKSSEGDTDPMNQPDAAQHPLDSRAPIESTAFGSVSMAEPARQMSKSAEDDDGPQYRPASPMYRPSSPPLTTHLVGDSAPTSSYLPMVKHEIDPDAPSRPYLPGRESLNLAGTEATSYFPSAPSSHYEPIPRSSNMRSPSPSATRPLPSPAPSMRSRRSPSPPPTGRWPPPPAASHGDPPTGPRLSSGFNRWPPRGRGRGYGQFPNYERPPPPRAPRAFGSAPTMPQRSFWPSRSGPPADRERSVYQGAPRGPRTRGSPWRGRGR